MRAQLPDSFPALMRRPNPPANQRSNARDTNRTENYSSSPPAPLGSVVQAVIDECAGDHQPGPDHTTDYCAPACSRAGSNQDRVHVAPTQPDRQRGISLALHRAPIIVRLGYVLGAIVGAIAFGVNVLLR